ncbi:acyl-coenzyme A thioesterase 13-like [Oratosquilla oratoria]|uniref:acyl-coenzyme A thioesterase 13-like n=1 Tax=Oratosquilla oratoria TaxID=337810 RepID=UPI003F76380C
MASRNIAKYLQQAVAAVVERGGFDRHLAKVNIVSGGDGRCVAELVVQEEHKNSVGTLHGGFTATLVDAISTLALMSAEKTGPGVSIDLSVSYMNAAKSGDKLLIDANTVKLGKTLAFLKVDITNKETGRVIASGKHTKFVG